jgi:hypothetical protein
MKVENAFVGARGVDSLPFSQGGTQQQAHALFDRGVDFFVGYLGVINRTRLDYVLNAGLAFMPVTLAGEVFDGALDEIAQLKALGIPQGCTVWLDLEGKKMLTHPFDDLTRLVNDWARKVQGEGYIAGLYIAPPQPFTGPELAALAVTRYWNSAGRIWDRNGKIWDEPEGVGFCMHQGFPQGNFRDTGVFVDPDMIWQDRRGRVPTWAIA